MNGEYFKVALGPLPSSISYFRDDTYMETTIHIEEYVIQRSGHASFPESWVQDSRWYSLNENWHVNRDLLRRGIPLRLTYDGDLEPLSELPLTVLWQPNPRDFRIHVVWQPMHG